MMIYVNGSYMTHTTGCALTAQATLGDDLPAVWELPEIDDRPVTPLTGYEGHANGISSYHNVGDFFYTGLFY